MRTPRKSLVNIQILRGLASIAVVAKHASDQFPGIPSVPRIDATQAGVDVFFVISGFIMVYVTANRPQTGGGFLLNRIVRIAPNYWFYTLLTAALAVVLPSVFRGTSFGILHLILSMLFIAHVNPALRDSISPLLRVGWTLNYEMFFYLIFAASLVVRTASVMKRVSAAIACIVVLVATGLILHPHNLVAGFYTSDIMLEFVFGMLLAGAYFKGLPTIPKWIVPFALLASIAAIFATSNLVTDESQWRCLCFGIPALVIVSCALILESYQSERFAPLLRKLGDASFTIYLCHPFSTSLFRTMMNKVHFSPYNAPTNIAFIVFNVAVAAFIGYWAYRFIEVPLIALGKSVVREKSAA